MTDEEIANELFNIGECLDLIEDMQGDPNITREYLLRGIHQTIDEIWDVLDVRIKLDKRDKES